MFKFAIECQKSPGILSQIVVATRRSSSDIKSQQIDDDGEHRIVTLDFAATKDEAKKLYQFLKQSPGIFDVKAYSTKDEAKAKQAKKKTKQAVRSVGSDGNDVSRIGASFPDIEELVLDVREQFSADSVASEMYSIGLDVAADRIENEEVELVENTGSLDDIIKNAVLPQLKLLGDADYVEEGFETGLMVMSSIFTKPSEGSKTSSIGNTFGSLESAAIRCDFLSGYIAGVVNAGSEDDAYTVRESRCRNEGHPYCLFEFDR